MRRQYRGTVAVLAAVMVLMTGCDFLNRLRGDNAILARAGSERLTVGEMAEAIGNAQVFPLDTIWTEVATWWWLETSLVLQRLEEGDSLLDTNTVRAVRWPDEHRAMVDAAYEDYRMSVAVASLDSAYEAGDIRVLDHVLLRAPPDTTPEVIEAQRRRAEALRRRLLAGLPWSEANELNEDANAKLDGGRVGVVTWGETAPSFERVAFQLDPGEISEVVESELGFHIIRRPTFDEVVQILAPVVRDTLFTRLRYGIYEDLRQQFGVEIPEGAPEVMRAAALAPNRAKTWSDPIAVWNGGHIDAADFVRWLQILPPDTHNNVPDMGDGELLEVARSIAAFQLEHDVLADSGVTLPPTLFASMRELVQRDLAQIRRATGADSALQAGGGEGATRGMALESLRRWMRDTRTYERAQVPAFLSDLLREEERWDVHFELIPLTTERAREIRRANQ